MRRSARTAQRSNVRLSEISSTSQSSPESDEDNSPQQAQRHTRKKKVDADYASGNDETDIAKPASKRRKTVHSSKRGNGNAHLHERIFGNAVVTRLGPCSLPTRKHSLSYHRPLLLDSRQGRDSLLEWFDTVSTDRSMPWRKAWIDPGSVPDKAELRGQLERRAYEVWISEIMLQQTRVAVVIDYWTRWMQKWPTIHDLATADSDDVLAAWRGLGYYSRATRIHEAAKLVCQDPEMQGLLPADSTALEAKIPGVGRYTAGAICSIVFGLPRPMVDGNVLRVLSRQLGLFGDVKTDKYVIDLLWAAAEALVKTVARDTGDTQDENGEDASEEQVNDRPGRWGQALMELGSTLCTPNPNCEKCPVSSTCRAYSEGFQFAVKKGLVLGDKVHVGADGVVDIEDSCSFCKPFEEYAEEGGGESDVQVAKDEARSRGKSRKQATLQSFAFTKSTKSKKPPATLALDAKAIKEITNHAGKFPVKTVKKAVREQQTLVCAIRRSDGQYLIHRRPEKGLLAGLWEFPSYVLPDYYSNTAKDRKKDAESYVLGLMNNGHGSFKVSKLKHKGELGSVPWLFSHLRLTMHVHLFQLDYASDLGVKTASGNPARWSDAVDDESMGTGMRKCWGLVKEAMPDTEVV